jgi:hypothetical protein
MVSNCCGAEIIENTDLCSDCKEHCSDFDNAMCLDGKKITYNGKVVKHENK